MSKYADWSHLDLIIKIEHLDTESAKMREALSSISGRHLPDCNYYANGCTTHESCDCAIGDALKIAGNLK